MSISYRDRDFDIELDGIEFLYRNESVRKACAYVDRQRNAIDWTFDSLMDITRTAIRYVRLDDPKMKLFVSGMFFYTVDEFLKMEQAAEGSCFHDYLMYDALAYYMYMHSTEVEYKKYQTDAIDITERLEKGGKKLQTCACGHKRPIIVISSLLEKACIRISCPHCGAKVIELLGDGHMVKRENGMYSLVESYSSLEMAINECIHQWELECEKTTEYKALELLISEFTWRIDVSPKVREYSRLLYGYVQRNKLNQGIKEDYKSLLVEKLYQDKAAMDIVNDYLWENSSNKGGDGIQPLATADFDIFSLIGVRCA